GDVAAAAVDVLHKGGLDLVGPLVPRRKFVVVAHHYLIFGEVGAKGGEVAAFGRGGQHVDPEKPAIFQNLLEYRGGTAPVVVILPVDDQGAQGGGAPGGMGEQGGQNQAFHPPNCSAGLMGTFPAAVVSTDMQGASFSGTVDYRLM